MKTKYLPLVLCVLPLAVLAQTPDEQDRDRGFLAGLLEDNLSGAGRHVQIDGFRGALSSVASIERMSIADEDSVWLIAEGLSLDWNRAALFGRRLDVNSLKAEKITLLRAPTSEESAALPSAESSPFALPQLPLAIEIDAFEINTLTLGESFIGQELELSIAGEAQLANGEGSAELTADVTRGNAGQLRLAGSYSNTTQYLDLDLGLTEAENGILANLLSLPGRPSVEIAVEGEGPIDAFSADLRLATEGEERLSGTVTLGTAAQTDAEIVQAFSVALQGDLTAVLPPMYHDFFGKGATLSLQGTRKEDGALSLPELSVLTQALTLKGTAELDGQYWPHAFALNGTLSHADGSPVILPGAGGMQVQAAALSLSFDATRADRWTTDTTLTEVQNGALRIPLLRLEGGGTIVPAGESREGLFSADLTYSAPTILTGDAAVDAALENGISGQVQLSRIGGAALQLGALSLQSGGLNAIAHGTIDEAFAFDGALDVSAADLAPFSPLAGRDLKGALNATLQAKLAPLAGEYALDLKGTSEGLTLGFAQLDPYLAPQTDLAFTLERNGTGTALKGLTLENSLLSGQGDVSLSSGPLTADVTLKIADLARGFEGLKGPALVDLKAERSAEGALSFDLSYTDENLPDGALHLRGVQGENGRTAIDLSAKLRDIAPYAAAFAGQSAQGAVEITGRGSLTNDFEAFEFDFNALTRNLALGNAQIDPLLQGTPAFTGRLSRTAADNLQFENLALRLPAIGSNATLNGRLSALDEVPRFSGNLALDRMMLAPLSRLAGRPLSGSLIGVEILAKDVVFDGSDVQVSLKSKSQNLALGINALDPLLQGLGTLNADLAFNDQGALALDAALSTPHARLTAKGALQDMVGDVVLDGAVPNIGLLMPGLSGEGRLNGTLTGRGKGDLGFTGAVSAPATAARLEIQSLPGSTSLLPEAYRVALTADISDLSVYSRIAGQRLSGAVQGLSLTGQVEPFAGLFTLNAKGSTANLNPGIDVAAKILAGTGNFEARVARTQSGENVPLTVENINVQYPNFTITGGLDAAGLASYNATLRDIGLLVPEYSGPVTATGTARAQSNGAWALDARLSAPGNADARLGGSYTPSLNRFDLKLEGSAPLTYANPFIDPTRAEGSAEFNLALQGPPALENISGTLRIINGRVAVPSLNTPISAITGTLRLSNGALSLEGVSARAGSTADEGGGQIEATGRIALSAPYAADLRLATRSPILVRSPLLYETFAETRGLTITGPLTGGARIAGLIELSKTEIRVPTSGVGALGDLPNVFHITPSPAVRLTIDRAGLSAQGAASTQVQSQSGATYGLDITVVARDNIFIRGRGLDAELAGQITVGGTTAAIRPVGEFSLVRGRLSILQQRFELTEGRISLGGDFNPVLLLEAKTTARTGTEVTVAIDGPLSDPKVTFSSSPELPQDEVLAQLIFGRDLSEITPLQAVQLAAAVGELAGTGGGVMDSLRSGAGLQDLEFLQDADGNAAVRLGKAITDKIYTDVTVGTADTEINLNLDLSQSVTVKATASSAGETSIGIFYQRDMD